jgi:hypothetical protein
VALFLQEHGYRAAALAGGYGGWRDAGLPLAPLPGGPAADGRAAASPLVLPPAPG